MLYLICAVAFLGIGAALLYHLRVHQGPRGAAIQLLGGSLGLVYHEKDNTILDRLKFFKIYDATTLQAAAYNVLRSKESPPDLWLFDYHARLGLRDSVMRPVQTVCYFNDPRLSLPGFRLFPRSMAGGPGAAVFNYRPIRFPSHPHFSVRLSLVGPNEQEVRALFTGERIGFFEKNAEYCIEGYGNELLLYHYRKMLTPAAYQQFLRHARSIFALFLGNGAAGQSGSA